MAEEKILVVDDEPDIQTVIKDILEDENYRVVTASGGEQARQAQVRHQPDLVLLDIWMPDTDGLSVLRHWHERQLDIPVVMISGHGNIETAVEALRYGAYDFLEKPLSTAKLLVTVERALEHRRLRRENRQLKDRLEPNNVLAGSGIAMQRLRARIERIAPTESRVLITGEAGSGKGVAARCLHQASRHRDAPLVELNLAAIPPQSLASQLFGSEEQGVVQHGRFEQAAGGSLLLDEIGDLDLEAQARLVNALEEGRFVRVGGRQEHEINVRIISLSNHDLEAAVRDNRFREDLYYRLNVVPLHVPPLREHSEDVPELAAFYLEWFANRENLPLRSLSKGALGSLQAHSWPGNVRELINVVQRLLILNHGDRIQPEEVRAMLRPVSPDESGASTGTDADGLGDAATLPFRKARDNFERRYFAHQLRKIGGNMTELARITGVERTHLYRKLKSLDLRPNGGHKSAGRMGSGE